MSIDDIVQYARAQHRYAGHLWRFSIVLIIVLPFVMYVISTGMFSFSKYNSGIYIDSSWDWTLFLSSLQDGTFWLSPGHIIFQDSMRLGSTWVETLLGCIAYILLCVFVIVVVYHVVAYVLWHWVFRKNRVGLAAVGEPIATALRSSSRPVRLGRWSNIINETDFELVGRTVLIEMPIKVFVPPVLFDAIQDGSEMREGWQLFVTAASNYHADEIVLDGVMYEHFRTYIPKGQERQMGRYLDGEINAHVVKKLEGVQIIVQGNLLQAAVDVKRLKSQQDVLNIADALEELVVIMAKRSKEVDIANDQVGGIGINGRKVVAFSKRLILKTGVLTVIVSLWVVMMIVLVVLQGKNALQGDAIFIVWIVSVCQIIALYHNYVRASPSRFHRRLK